MAEHRILLRGGWRRLAPGSETPDPGWVTLPLAWPDGPDGLAWPVRLVRTFGAPPIDRSRERLSLRLDAVPGLVAVWLNDREVARPLPGVVSLELGLDDPLPERNRLVLEVDPRTATAGNGGTGGWGEISLVIC